MATTTPRKETPVSMRFRDDDLMIIDRGAELLGLSRTEFMRRAALHEAQAAIVNETVIRLSPDAYDAFMQAISARRPLLRRRRLSGCAGQRLGNARWRFQGSNSSMTRTGSRHLTAASRPSMRG